MSSRDGTARDLIIDTDTLEINDDALALYYLLALGRIPRLISTVFGNASAASSARYARALVRGHSLDTDVVPGCEKPLWWHGSLREQVRTAVTALPGTTYLASLGPANTWFWDTSAEDGPGPDAIATVLRRSPRADILAIGPVTNIARALGLLDPSIPTRHRLWIAGGSTMNGNVTEKTEFNAFADPEALRDCLSAEWEAVVMVPLEVMAAPRLGPTAVDRIRRTGTPLGAALDKLERESPRGDRTDREPIWDVVAAALMTDEKLCHEQESGVLSVSTESPFRGEIRFSSGDGAHRLVTKIDPDAVVRRFEAVVGQPRMSR